MKTQKRRRSDPIGKDVVNSGRRGREGRSDMKGIASITNINQ